MSSLSLSTQRDSGQTVVALTGELDLATVASLREAGFAELEDPRCTGLVLELSGLSFVDSTGLGCWVELHNRAEALGKSLALDDVRPAIRRTITIAGLASLLGVPPSGLDGDETSAT